MIVAHILLMLISGIIFFVCLIGLVFEEEDGYFYVGFTSFIICIVLVVFFIVGCVKCEKANWVTNEEPYATESITAINDNNLMNGKFYLRSGYIEEDLYYQYIVQLNNGGFKTNKVKSSNATLFYDTDNYRIEWYTKTRSWLYFEHEVTYVEIYIPEGSISTDYSIDLS